MSENHEIRPGEIFVFGSNRLGIHGAGAALTARAKYGAVNGRGEGISGRSYAVPTKATPYETLPLPEIEEHIREFLDYAKFHPSYDFFVTALGTGLAGYSDEEIAPMFKAATINVRLPPTWNSILRRQGPVPNPTLDF